MKRLILMRGLSGSGKSTKAHLLAKEYGGIIFSTDNFFYKNGIYSFDASKLALYHQKTQRLAQKAMKKNTPCVIIDNTNSQLRAMRIYVKIALQYGYEVFFAYAHTDWAWNVGECFQRNTHKVPFEIIEKTFHSFEYPNEYDIPLEKILESI